MDPFTEALIRQHNQARQQLMDHLMRSQQAMAGVSGMAQGGAIGYPMSGAATGQIAGNYGQVPGASAAYGGPYGGGPGFNQAYQLPGDQQPYALPSSDLQPGYRWDQGQIMNPGGAVDVSREALDMGYFPSRDTNYDSQSNVMRDDPGGQSGDEGTVSRGAGW